MQRDRGRGLKKLPINCTQNPDIVIRSRGRADDAVVGIDHLHELADDEGDRLDPFHLFLGSEELALEILLLIFDVLFLDLDELELALERFEVYVEVVGGGWGGGGGDGVSGRCGGGFRV